MIIILLHHASHLLCRFRWVYCQLEFLRQCLPQRVPRALDELPETLDETYGRTLQCIGKANWKYAHRLFQCVAVASRPLRVEELAEFLLFNFDTGSIPDFDPDWRQKNPGDAVLSTCSSLLAIVNVNGSKVIQFSHYSVKEFLTSERITQAGDAVSQYRVFMESAHTVVAQACLAILLKVSPNSNQSTIQSIPLAPYAALHWVDHALVENVSRNIQDGMKRLFDSSKPYFVVWAWICATTPGFLLQAALESVSRLTQTQSDGDICCDFRDVRIYTVTEHPLDTTSWVSNTFAFHHIWNLNRNMYGSHSFVWQTVHMVMRASKRNGLRYPREIMMGTWAMLVTMKISRTPTATPH